MRRYRKDIERDAFDGSQNNYDKTNVYSKTENISGRWLHLIYHIDLALQLSLIRYRLTSLTIDHPILNYKGTD